MDGGTAGHQVFRRQGLTRMAASPSRESESIGGSAMSRVTTSSWVSSPVSMSRTKTRMDSAAEFRRRSGWRPVRPFRPNRRYPASRQLKPVPARQNRPPCYRRSERAPQWSRHPSHRRRLSTSSDPSLLASSISSTHQPGIAKRRAFAQTEAQHQLVTIGDRTAQVDFYRVEAPAAPAGTVATQPGRPLSGLPSSPFCDFVL